MNSENLNAWIEALTKLHHKEPLSARWFSLACRLAAEGWKIERYEAEAFFAVLQDPNAKTYEDKGFEADIEEAQMYVTMEPEDAQGPVRWTYRAWRADDSEDEVSSWCDGPWDVATDLHVYLNGLH